MFSSRDLGVGSDVHTTSDDILVPKGQSLFIWDNGSAVTPVIARDAEEAYRMVIANRMLSAEGDTELEKARQAIGWFQKNDTLVEVDCGVLEQEPYMGELPEVES